MQFINYLVQLCALFKFKRTFIKYQMLFFEKNKLSSSLEVPIILKILFKVINFFTPKLAVILATKLFTKPIQFKTPERELGMLTTSQKKRLSIPKINKEVEILSYGYSDKKVLFAHGWAGRSTQLFMIANKLLEHGFMVISFDAPAHGKSTGKATNLIEYVESIEQINQNFGPFVAAVGHSFGGMAILNAQANKGIFKTLITIGSGDKISTILNNFSKNLGLNSSFGKKLKNHINKKWNCNVDDFSSSLVVKKIEEPILIIHDTLDGDVHVSCALQIRQNLKNGNLLITEGLGHTKILRTKEISNRIVTFIENNT